MDDEEKPDQGETAEQDNTYDVKPRWLFGWLFVLQVILRQLSPGAGGMLSGRVAVIT